MATTYLGGSVTFTCTKADIFMEIACQIDLLPLSSLYFQPCNKINTIFIDVVLSNDFNNTFVWCKSKYASNSGQSMKYVIRINLEFEEFIGLYFRLQYQTSRSIRKWYKWSMKAQINASCLTDFTD